MQRHQATSSYGMRLLKIEGDKQSRLKGDVDFDKTRIAISGFSSGGNIALDLALSISPPQVKAEGQVGSLQTSPVPYRYCCSTHASTAGSSHQSEQDQRGSQ